MATVITLIKPSEIVNTGIVKAAPMASRFDASIIAPNIHIAEDRFLKTFIQKTFYDALIAAKNTTPCNYNPALGTLVDAFPNDPVYEFLWTEYLYDYLSRASYFQSLTAIAVQSGSNGMFTNNQDYGQNIQISGVKFIMDVELQTIESRKAIILKYLCDNKALFPLFDYDTHCGCDGAVKEDSSKNLGIIIY